MADEPQEPQDLQQAPCPICGGREFVWGRSALSWFRPDGSQAIADWQEQRARQCERCGNLQIFAVPPKRKKPSSWNRFLERLRDEADT